jgi:hypothetical protein
MCPFPLLYPIEKNLVKQKQKQIIQCCNYTCCVPFMTKNKKKYIWKLAKIEIVIIAKDKKNFIEKKKVKLFYIYKKNKGNKHLFVQKTFARRDGNLYEKKIYF